MFLVVGLGMPRSGTKSLTRLLANQEGFVARHESKPRLPWKVDCEAFEKKFSFLKTSPKREKTIYWAEVGFYYLPYVETFMEIEPKSKFVCLKREKEKVIRSLSWRSRNKNPYRKDSTSTFQRSFPTYSEAFAKSKEECISCHYDLYYKQAYIFEEVFPNNFKIFESPQVLNSKQTREDLFEWIEYPIKNVNHDLNYRIDTLTAREMKKSRKIDLLEKTKKGNVE